MGSRQVGYRVNDPASGQPLAQFGVFPDGRTALKISKPGIDVTTARPEDLVFDSTKNLLQAAIVDTYTFPGISQLGANASQIQTFILPHGINGVPGFLVYFQTFNNQTAPYFNIFPNSYYTQLTDHFTSAEPSAPTQMNSAWGLGIDSVNLYVSRVITNTDNSNAHDAASILIKYYIYQQTIT